jgi:MFS family permease
VQTSTPPRPGVLGRASAGVRATLSPVHPVARALTWATMSSALSSGLFYTVSALYFTRAVGLSATTVGLGLTIAGAVGVTGSLGAGYLADHLGARRVLLLSTLGQGLALVAYALVSRTLPFVLVACAAVGLRSMQGTARQAVLARSFTGPGRVDVRARLRVVTNVFIGLGTVVAGAALLLDTAAAYRTTVVLAGLLVLASCVPLLRLARSAGAVEPVGGEPDVVAPVPRGSSPLRDRRYLTLTALNAVLAMHFGLQTVGVPLWVATRTEAPEVTVSALLVLNTVLVALFQVRAARGTDDVRSAGRAVVRSGAALAAACGCYAAAGSTGALVAVALLVVAAVAHSAGEMWSEAGSWGLAFELADPRSAGAYQGVSQTGYSLGAMLAPLVVTATAIEHGPAGWAVLAAAFLVAAVLTGVVAHRAGGRLTALS